MWRQIIINMVLIIIYGYFFGQHSIKRYAVKGVIIIEQEENNVLITTPGKLNCITDNIATLSTLFLFQSLQYFPKIQKSRMDGRVKISPSAKNSRDSLSFSVLRSILSMQKTRL